MAAAWFFFPNGVILLKQGAFASGLLSNTLAHEEAHYVLGPRTWGGPMSAGHQEVYAIGDACGDVQF
jgi:hypothetical protein